MAYFPFFIELKHKKCCVIGGGMVAFRKIEALLEFEADISAISPVFCDEITSLGDRLCMISKAYDEGDMEDAFLVIAATDDREVNKSISKACIDRNILVNTVDEIEYCSFLFPAYVKMGDISIGVVTSGKSPVMAGIIRKIIRKSIPDFYTVLVDNLGKYRGYVKSKLPLIENRNSVFKKLASVGISKGGILSEEDVDTVIHDIDRKKE